jgi:hypothetical protein
LIRDSGFGIAHSGALPNEIESRFSREILDGERLDLMRLGGAR